MQRRKEYRLETILLPAVHHQDARKFPTEILLLRRSIPSDDSSLPLNDVEIVLCFYRFIYIRNAESFMRFLPAFLEIVDSVCPFSQELVDDSYIRLLHPFYSTSVGPRRIHFRTLQRSSSFFRAFRILTVKHKGIRNCNEDERDNSTLSYIQRASEHSVDRSVGRSVGQLFSDCTNQPL